MRYFKTYASRLVPIAHCAMAIFAHSDFSGFLFSPPAKSDIALFPEVIFEVVHGRCSGTGVFLP